MPMPGVFSNMIAKSGGNTYTGTFYMDYEKKEWGSRNIDDRQLALGVTGVPGLDARDTNRVDEYKDIDGGAGGYIIKDKLWWAGSFRYNASDVRFVNFPAKPQYTRIVSKNIKATYNLTPNHKFVGFYSHNMKVQPEFFRTKTLIFPTLDEPLDEDFPISQWQGRVQRGAVQRGVPRSPHRRVLQEILGVLARAQQAVLQRHRDADAWGRRSGHVRLGLSAADERLDQLLQERLGQQPQLQGRLGGREVHRAVPGNTAARVVTSMFRKPRSISSIVSSTVFRRR